MDFQSWRCCHDGNQFCPPEGCASYGRDVDGTEFRLGCARQRGWKTGDPTPQEYRGQRAPCRATVAEIRSAEVDKAKMREAVNRGLAAGH